MGWSAPSLKHEGSFLARQHCASKANLQANPFLGATTSHSPSQHGTCSCATAWGPHPWPTGHPTAYRQRIKGHPNL